MNSLTKPLEIDYLAVNQTLEIETIIKDKFKRLNDVCNYIIKCQIKVANIACHHQVPSKFMYMVSINITMPEGFDLYTLRLPQNKHNDSVEEAISDVFAMIYRKLIELQLETSLQAA